MLEDSRAYLCAFMVSCLYDRRGPFEVLKPSPFADVMESINPGRRDPLLGTECQAGFVWVLVTWLQFPSNINVMYNGVGKSHSETDEITTITELGSHFQFDKRSEPL